MRGRVDGLVVMGPDLDGGVLAEALPAGLPAVLVNCEAPGACAHELRVDNVGGARAATAHLLALGHRRVAHARGAARNFDARERLLGYRAALAAAGVAARAEYEVDAEFSEAGGYGAARALMALPEPPTALFCANDASAIGALSALRELGVEVPGRVAVAGFDDVPMARYACPPLTSARAHVEALGARAAEVLLQALAPASGAGAAPVRELLPTTLVVRASCGAGPATERPPPAPRADAAGVAAGCVAGRAPAARRAAPRARRHPTRSPSPET
jgi:LacI family transcriptional regulator